MASLEEDAWYLEASTLPVGWNAGAVAFKLLPFCAAVLLVSIAPGAMMLQ
jgi:hypothetical protein